MVEKNKPHVVCIPYPSQGHINPMLKLAKLLHSRSGFHVTFVNNHYNHRRLLRAGGLSGPPSFRFDSIPDGLPGPEEADVTQDVFALSLSIEATCSGPLKELIERLNDTASSGVPPVTCIVTDLGMHFALDVATEIGIPIVALMTTSASCLFLMTQFRKLLELGIIPFKGKDSSSNEACNISLPKIEDLQIRVSNEIRELRMNSAQDNATVIHLIEDYKWHPTSSRCDQALTTHFIESKFYSLEFT